jgi:hypothetical protein
MSNFELRKQRFRKLLDRGDVNAEDFEDFMSGTGRFSKAQPEEMPFEIQDDFAPFAQEKEEEKPVIPPKPSYETKFTERRKLEGYIRNLLTNLVSKVRNKKGITLDAYEAIIERLVKKIIMKFADSASSVLNEGQVKEIIIKCLLEE